MTVRREVSWMTALREISDDGASRNSDDGSSRKVMTALREVVTTVRREK